MFEVLESPRAVRCEICATSIDKGTVRLTAGLGSGFYPKHYHLPCFVREYAEGISGILEYLVPHLSGEIRREIEALQVHDKL